MRIFQNPIVCTAKLCQDSITSFEKSNVRLQYLLAEFSAATALAFVPSGSANLVATSPTVILQCCVAQLLRGVSLPLELLASL